MATAPRTPCGSPLRDRGTQAAAAAGSGPCAAPRALDASAQRLRDLLSAQRGAGQAIGYQLNLSGWEGLENESADIASLFSLHYNNVGDPFNSKCPACNTNELETDVVAAFAAWLGLPGPIEAVGGAGGCAAADNLSAGWGYVVPGSSLGNLQGMWQGREALEPTFTLIVPTSAHLSVLKNAHLLGIPPTRIHVVPAGPDGAVDVAAFGAALEGCSSALVVLTLGTTMHGAYDDVTACIRLLNARWGGQWSAVPPTPARGGNSGGSDSSEGGSDSSSGGGCDDAMAHPPGSSGRRRLNYYLHLDCALGGLVLPFLRQAPPIGDGSFPPPRPVAATAAAGASSKANVRPAENTAAAAKAAAAAALPSSACAPEWGPPAPRAPHGAAASRHRRRRHWRDRRRSGGAAAGNGAPPAAARTTPVVTSPPRSATTATAAAAADGVCLTEARLPPPDTSMAFDFATPEVCSLTVSLHKQLGVGTVAAVFLSRAPYSARLSVFQEYIFSSDPTLLCSRDGHLALRAWLRLRGIGGWHGLSAMAHRAVDRAARLTERLCAAGIPAAVAPRGVCVRFPIDSVPDDTADAFGVRRCCGTGHVFVMDSVPDAVLSALTDSMARKAAAEKAAAEAVAPPPPPPAAACTQATTSSVLLPALPAPVRAH